MPPSMQSLPLPVQRLALVQFLSLVPVPARDLEAIVDRAVAENPALERGPRGACGRCGSDGHRSGCPLPGARAGRVDVPEAADDVDWRAELAAQARLEVVRRLHPLVDRVVAGLDDHGFLPDPVEDAPPEDLAAALAAVRLVGPLGVAASSPLDCVRVQARTLTERGPVPHGLLTVVDAWLPALAAGLLADIARGTGLTVPDVEACGRFVRQRLRPFVVLPGTTGTGGPVDVVLSRTTTAGMAVHVPDAAALGLSVDRSAAGLGPQARAWLAPHTVAADRLVAAVDARAWMLARVAEVLVRRQEAFVRHGPAAHRPLRRGDVAHELGVHPSTVGRAVAGKVARCPDGRVVALEEFFGAATSTRVRVLEAVEQLPGASDERVAAHLRASGLVIARRTVAKYRALDARSR